MENVYGIQTKGFKLQHLVPGFWPSSDVLNNPRWFPNKDELSLQDFGEISWHRAKNSEQWIIPFALWICCVNSMIMFTKTYISGY